MNDIIKCTRHAETRMQQRGIAWGDILTVLAHGTPIDDMTVLLREQDVAREIDRLKQQIRRDRLSIPHARQCIRALERNRNRQVVLSGDQLLTVYRPRRAAQKRSLRLARTKGYTTK